MDDRQRRRYQVVSGRAVRRDAPVLDQHPSGSTCVGASQRFGKPAGPLWPRSGRWWPFAVETPRRSWTPSSFSKRTGASLRTVRLLDAVDGHPERVEIEGQSLAARDMQRAGAGSQDVEVA